MGGGAGHEIERKFLVRRLPAALVARRVRRLVQGYLVAGDDGEARLREAADGLWLTVKSGGGLVRREVEVELDRGQFEQLWPATEGRRVEKTRHEIPLGNLVVEVDVYGGRCEGLVTAEVEFANLVDATRFEPPAWFGDEVTEDVRYRNRVLATRGRP